MYMGFICIRMDYFHIFIVLYEKFIQYLKIVHILMKISHFQFSLNLLGL